MPERMERAGRGPRGPARDDLYSATAEITITVREKTEPGDAEDHVAAWVLNQEQLGRARSGFEEVNALGQYDMASLSLAMRQFRSISRR